MKTIDRPIFVVGHCRGGSTVLGAILDWHSQISSAYTGLNQFSTINHFVDRIYDQQFHTNYRLVVEQGDVWKKFFPLNESFDKQHKHYYRKNIVELLPEDRERLVAGLVKNISSDKRYLSKHPPHALQISTLKKYFPDSKIISICRRCRQVTGSYLLHGPINWRKLPDSARVERSVSRWKSYMDEILSHENDIKIITYSMLANRTEETLTKLLEYVEVDYEPYIKDIKLKETKNKWKKSIPTRQHNHEAFASIEKYEIELKRIELEF